jgi:hypothetical protein
VGRGLVRRPRGSPPAGGALRGWLVVRTGSRHIEQTCRREGQALRLPIAVAGGGEGQGDG